jgi:ABC-type multidrug transport system ATPase subunit
MRLISSDGVVVPVGATFALLDVSLSVDQGECVGIIGENGSGKTTLLRALSGLAPRSAGRLTVLDIDPLNGKRLARSLGVVHQYTSMPGFLTAADLLMAEASMRGLRRRDVSRVLSLLGLSRVQNALVSTLSPGVQRRLAIAKAVIHEPPLLLLDEPTAGIDPLSRIAIWEILQRMKEEGTTLIVASNDLEEIARLASRVVVLVSGRVVADLTSVELGVAGPLKCDELRRRLSAYAPLVAVASPGGTQ